MCDPIVTPILIGTTMAMQGAGAIQQSNSAKAKGKADQSYYDYVAAQNKQNADQAIKMGEQRANQAQMQGSIEATQNAKQAGVFGATQRAALVANGIGAGSVTAEDIGRDTLNKEELDQQAIRYNADMSAWSSKTGAAYQAWDYENQAALNTVAGKNARTAGNQASKAALISGATNVLSTGAGFAMYKSPTKIA